VEQIRTFVAIELSQELKDSLGHLQDQLECQIPERAVRWVRPEGIHLTLRFLGDVPATRIDSIARAVEIACRGSDRFTVELIGVGCFPNLRRPRVVWVGVHEPTGTLTRLHKAVENQLAGIGFKPEGRPFRPHLTLGRVQRRVRQSDRERLGQLIAGSKVGLVGRMQATTVNVMRSDLRPSGAVYTALAQVPL
jgi:2'-5' RNA ligase